jgi:hypothetical protein
MISATASRRGLLIANIKIAAASSIKTTARSNMDDHHGNYPATIVWATTKKCFAAPHNLSADGRLWQ